MKQFETFNTRKTVYITVLTRSQRGINGYVFIYGYIYRPTLDLLDGL
jgi:hypothetical protein